MQSDIEGIVARYLAEPRAAWAIGAPGAIAEFRRDPGEPTTLGAMRAETLRGAIAVTAHAQARPVEREGSDEHGGRFRSIVFALPDAAARMPPNLVLTELGPDGAAARRQDVDAILFDLGLALEHCRACVRTDDALLIATLRAAAGTKLLTRDRALFSAIAAANPHRVFVSPLARIEVFAPIPRVGGVTPEGPHTHILPALLARASDRSGLLPGFAACLELFLPDDEADGTAHAQRAREAPRTRMP